MFSNPAKDISKQERNIILSVKNEEIDIKKVVNQLDLIFRELLDKNRNWADYDLNKRMKSAISILDDLENIDELKKLVSDLKRNLKEIQHYHDTKFFDQNHLIYDQFKYAYDKYKDLRGMLGKKYLNLENINQKIGHA